MYNRSLIGSRIRYAVSIDIIVSDLEEKKVKEDDFAYRTTTARHPSQ